MALDLTIKKSGGKKEGKQENDKMEVSQGENTGEEEEEKGADNHDSLGCVVGVEEQAREEVDESTERLVQEMAKEDGRNVLEKEVSLQTQSRVIKAEIIMEEEEVERGGERETKRNTDGDSRARKRVRQSLKRYRESESSSSSDETSSSDEEDNSNREIRFTNILSEMIRKTGSIVGEQVIANAGLIKSLQKSVDDLRKEVKEMRSELRERKGKNEDRSKENKRPEVREVRGESGPAKAHERKERDRDVKKDEKRERPAERERQRKSGGSSRDGYRRVERGRDYIRL
ncbi:calponin homology domain-containing protein DDB_G0272472-like [Ruditapes philippinarum]|uniref:calponin homology domain-containing protein DDB_G0272472-like n=1 Tax=Ruditapes philippinarum TaxID=129788 RepID=UPI00295BC44C|nr:calponin homology domain-containing protein DDB_G0272472-like [Ruditapes philippinarum]